MIRAAGCLFVTPDGLGLFLKRGDGGDAPGAWCWPGGRAEDGETPEQAAIRETLEEAGFEVAPASLLPHTRSISEIAGPGPSAMPPAGEDVALQAADPAGVPAALESVDFTTYLVRVAEPFMPVLNEEHSGWAWASLDSPPLPLHPGAQVAIDRLTADELGVARMMAAGQLTSPQVYGTMHLWAIRITGTGVSYRQGLDEFVLRDPAIYLNDEFLARCAGLPVIMLHTEEKTLGSEEFAEKAVGTVMFAYVEGDDVWGIARIYDAGANDLMDSKQVSTSPNVVFRGADVGEKLTLADGSTLLIEGKPYLLDHLAICPLGVWDKGGDPVGVRKDSQPEPIASAPRRLDPTKLRRLLTGAALLDIQVRTQSARVGR